jgi:DNA-directed RNA polymerase II subunit GRINL1A
MISLPDNGERLKTFASKIEAELSKRIAVDGVADIFSKLNISSSSVDQLEWCGSTNQEKNKIKNCEKIDLIACTNNMKFSADSASPVKLDSHASYLCRMENLYKITDKFLPYKTTKSDVHDPEKEKLRKKNKYWENTAATPPLIQHCAAKLLTLSESLELENEQREKLLKIANVQASERLREKQNRSYKYGKMVQTENFANYRCYEQNSGTSTGSDDNANDDNDDDDSDDDANDADDNKEKGGVLFPVYD